MSVCVCVYVRMCVNIYIYMVCVCVSVCVFVCARRLKFSPRRENVTCILLAALFAENRSMANSHPTRQPKIKSKLMHERREVIAAEEKEIVEIDSRKREQSTLLQRNSTSHDEGS